LSLDTFGDPLHITGSVYNDVNMPPWELPKHKTVSGVKTQSSEGGSVDTNTVQQPVVGFLLTNVGLEAGVSLQGAEIEQIQP
jgi:lipid-binding SYLF domain-containing protein